MVQAGVVCIIRKHTHALLNVWQIAYSSEATEPFMWSLSHEKGGWPFWPSSCNPRLEQVEESVHDTDIHVHAVVSVIN